MKIKTSVIIFFSGFLCLAIPSDILYAAQNPPINSEGKKLSENYEVDEARDFNDGFEESFENDDTEDFNDDFEDDFNNETVVSEDAKPSFYTLNGSLEIGAAYNVARENIPPSGTTDWSGLSRLRSEITLEFDAKLSQSWRSFISGRGYHDLAYSLNGRREYTDQVIDEYEQDAEFGQAYVQGSITKRMDIKLGRQIIVWGKSDNIRVTDVLNPMDIAEPGLTDLEDLRLPVFMTRIDYYYGDWNLSCVGVNEHRYNKNPVFGSDFYPYPFPQPDDDIPSRSLDNTEFAAALNGTFTGWDLSLYIANYYDDMPHALFSSSQLKLEHSRLTMLGAAYNRAFGNWLLKTEGAWLDGLQYSAYFDGIRIQNVPGKFSRIDLLAGFEYAGFDETLLSFEVVNRHVQDFEKIAERSGEQMNSFESAARISKDFMNDTLTLTFLALLYGATGEDGGICRFTSEYEINDNLETTCGIVLYHSGDLFMFENIGDNDRIYLDLKYSF